MADANRMNKTDQALNIAALTLQIVALVGPHAIALARELSDQGRASATEDDLRKLFSRTTQELEAEVDRVTP